MRTRAMAITLGHCPEQLNQKQLRKVYSQIGPTWNRTRETGVKETRIILYIAANSFLRLHFELLSNKTIIRNKLYIYYGPISM